MYCDYKKYTYDQWLQKIKYIVIRTFIYLYNYRDHGSISCNFKAIYC